MRKADMIELISRQTGIEKVDVLVIIEAFFVEVKDTVISGDYAAFHGFGVFKPIIKAEKKGRNIKAGTDVLIPKRYAPKFVPSNSFMELIRSVAIESEKSEPKDGQ